MDGPIERLILRLATISFAALIMGSCSKQLDSASNTAERSQQAERDRSTNSPSGTSAEDTNRTEAEESESQPSADDIIDDCRGFVWLTKAVPGDAVNTNCPGCPVTKEAPQVFAFRSAQVKRVSCTGERCEVDVAIRANFNPSNSGTITGGLTGWIPLEQREQYSRGETPPGEQKYDVGITYAREANGWRVVEFARP